MAGPRDILRRYAPLAIGGWALLTVSTLGTLMSGDTFAAIVIFLCLTFWVPACIIGMWVEMRSAWIGREPTRNDVEVPIARILGGITFLLIGCVAAFILVPAILDGVGKKPVATPTPVQPGTYKWSPERGLEPMPDLKPNYKEIYGLE